MQARTFVYLMGVGDRQEHFNSGEGWEADIFIAEGGGRLAILFSFEHQQIELVIKKCLMLLYHVACIVQ